VCVVDLPDEEWGQLVAAAVVPTDPARPPAVEALRAAVRARLGGPATPKVLRFVDALPLQGPGKVNRIGVKDMLHGT
jgi:O-succinylbenzoic acid--CoA ligase